MSTSDDKAHQKARLKLAGQIPSRFFNLPFEIENTDDDVLGQGPKNSSQDKDMPVMTLLGALKK